jgi:hypothetical protein
VSDDEQTQQDQAGQQHQQDQAGQQHEQTDGGDHVEGDKVVHEAPEGE